jgi:hypothetical protein
MVRVSNWWSKKDGKYDDIKALVENLVARQKPQHEREKQFARMYSNRNIMGMDSFNYYKIDPRREADEDKIRLNAVAAVIDTLTSKLAVEQPRVIALTTGADFDVRSKAKKLQQFIDGILESSGAYVETLKAFRDAEIVGTGVLSVYDEWGNIKCERIPKHEILIDEEEAFYGCMSQLHQVKVISRDKLVEMFPAKKRQIDQATKITSEGINVTEISDLIEVRMSWHLPSSPDAKDGRHVISIDTCDLVDEPYKSREFPFVFIHWKEPVYGFWGTGVVEELKSLQIEINRLLMSAQKAMRAASNPMIFIPAGSSISKLHMSNEIGAIVPFVGQPPIVRVHQTVHPEILQQIENLYRKCFEIIGVSMMSAAGQKPAGVNAAVAMRELQNIESERFSVTLRGYSMAFVELAKKMIGVAKALYSENEADTRVFIKAKGFLNRIDWSVVDLEEDQFQLDLDTANKLPLTRAGRISTITEWYQAGIIDGDKWRSLMNMPDVDEENELKDAPKEFIREVVHNILFEGSIMPPEEHDHLEFALEYSIMQYQRAKLEKFPDDRIDLLSQYISMIEFKIKQAQEQMKAQAAAQAPPPGPPQGQMPMPQEAAAPPMPPQ